LDKQKKQALALAFAVLAALRCQAAMAAPPTEYEVKAAFIHNIAKFVEWPAVPSSVRSARLCVLGQNPFGEALEALQGKPVGRLNWEIVQADGSASLKECRVLFISASERSNLGRILESIASHPVLTIGDSEGYAEQGVMVNFYPEQNKVRFEINLAAATGAGLKISSQLLKLARIVRPAGGRP
jgi:hypothetical protein